MNSRQGIILCIGILAYLSHIGSCQTHVEQGTEHANSGSMKLIANLPRYGDDAVLNHEDFEQIPNSNDYSDYWKGIASLVVIPVALLIISLLLCPIWTVCRCCKCCCCKKKQPKKAITKCQIYLPLFLLFASTIAIIVMASIGYKANTDFSGALLHNTGEGEDGNLFDVTQTLLNDASNKVFDINAATEAIEECLMDIIDQIKDILNDTAILTAGPSSLIAMLTNISDSWSNYTITTNYNNATYEFECEFCTSFGAEIDNITNQIGDQIGPMFADLNKTVTAINSSLISAEDEIIMQINNFTTQIDNAGDDIASYQADVDNTRPDVVKYNTQRELAYNIMFAIPLLPIIFILFGAILKKPGCFTCSYICLWFSCTLMWLLLGIHLPIAVLLHDSCEFLDVTDSDVTGAYPNNTAAEIFEACLNGDKLVKVLGLESSLNFSNIIEWESLGNVTDKFQFNDLLSFEDDASATDFTTFYEAGDAALAAINNLTLDGTFQQTIYARNNISTLKAAFFYAPADPRYAALDSLKNQTIALLGAESSSINAFNLTVYEIKADVASVTDKVSGITLDTQKLVNDVDNASYLLDPLFVKVDVLINETECSFIGDAYYDTKAVMCQSVLGALSRVVVAMFVIAVLSVFGCMISVKMVRRVEWLQVQKREDKDNKLRQSFQPNKPTIVLMQPQRASVHSYQPGGNIVNPAQGVYYNQNI